MQILLVALVHFGLVFAGVETPAVSSTVAQAEARCPATALEDRLPTIIAPMAGSEPIWLVDGSFNRWSGPERNGFGSYRVGGYRLGAGQ